MHIHNAIQDVPEKCPLQEGNSAYKWTFFGTSGALGLVNWKLQKIPHPLLWILKLFEKNPFHTLFDMRQAIKFALVVFFLRCICIR